MTKVIIAFRSFANAPEYTGSYFQSDSKWNSVSFRMTQELYQYNDPFRRYSFSNRPVDHNDTENMYETFRVTLRGEGKPLNQTLRTTSVRDDKDEKIYLLQRAISKHYSI